MKKSTKTAIIVSLCLIAAGILVCIGVVCFPGFSFLKLDNTEYVTNTHEIESEINNINISTDTADVKILKSSDKSISVTCYEDAEKPHTVTAENGLLTIQSSKKHWYDHIQFFNFSSPEITLSLPQDMYDSFIIGTDTGDISTDSFTAINMLLETDTGDVNLLNINHAENISIESDTGDILIENSNCNKLTTSTDTGNVNLLKVKTTVIEAESDTGDVSFKSTTAKDNISVETSTGDIIFESSDGKNIYAESSTGDIKGTILTAKVFSTQSSTGKVSVPELKGSGIFEASTSTGDITISYGIAQR